MLIVMPEPASTPTRPARPTLAELRAVSQPPTVVGRRNSEHWAGIYLRKISIHLTRLLLPTGVSANAVTWIMIVIGICAAFVLVLPGWWPVLACAVGIQLHIMVDCADGEIARWRGQQSVAGVYIDRVGHYVVEGMLPIALGVHLDGGLTSPGGWTTLGALVSVVVLMKKAFGDLIHVARTYAGWPKLTEDSERAAPRSGALATVRAVLKFIPFFRAFGAIEYTLILAVVASADALLRLAGLEATTAGEGLLVRDGHLVRDGLLRIWMLLSIPLALATAGGYLLAILASSRLRHP